MDRSCRPTNWSKQASREVCGFGLGFNNSSRSKISLYNNIGFPANKPKHNHSWNIVCHTCSFLLLYPKEVRSFKGQKSTRSCWRMASNWSPATIRRISWAPPHHFGSLSRKVWTSLYIRIGVHTALVISRWELAKECFTTNDVALYVFSSQPCWFKTLGLQLCHVWILPLRLLLAWDAQDNHLRVTLEPPARAT